MKNKDDDLNLDYTKEEFERFLAYRDFPVSKKLQWLDEMFDFYQELIPRENKLKWQKLKDMGF